MKVDLDKHDLKMIFESLCFYDMHKDHYFNSVENDSFHYLYSLTSPENRK